MATLKPLTATEWYHSLSLAPKKQRFTASSLKPEQHFVHHPYTLRFNYGPRCVHSLFDWRIEYNAVIGRLDWV